MTHLSHTHGGLTDHHQDPALAANIDITAEQTAETAYSGTFDALPVYTAAQQVDDIDNLSTWDTDSVTFSFPTVQSDDYIGTGRDGTLASFSVAQAAAAREVLSMFADLINLEMIDSGTDVDADIRLYNSTIAGTAGGAPAGAGTAGDMWIYNYDPATIGGYNLDPGSYQWHLLVHEMGHIMGLSHTKISAGDTYDEYATYLQNNQAYTQMSYTCAVSGGLEWATSYASTPMIIDIAALQSIYGANMETRAADTVYGFNSTADRDAFDFDILLEQYSAIGAIAIWDGGGIDTLDMSKFSEDGFINLGAGTHSSVGGYEVTQTPFDKAWDAVRDAESGLTESIEGSLQYAAARKSLEVARANFETDQERALDPEFCRLRAIDDHPKGAGREDRNTTRRLVRKVPNAILKNMTPEEKIEHRKAQVRKNVAAKRKRDAVTKSLQFYML